MRDPKFDDLRPYCDEEIAPAMQRIAASEQFPLLSAYVYPDRDPEDVKKMILGYTSIDEFQLQVMKAVNEQVIARGVRQFSFDGLDELDKNERYLFVSNHRDIMLDATLLQYALHLSGHRTSEISFGSNLMRPELVVDIGKSNKMYKVIRGGNMKDFYHNSLHLSEYIRHTILEKRESVWIAQANGRRKDGLDNTEPGIIRMFYMSQAENPVKALADLRIVPIAISYQWESCDTLKAVELYHRQKEGSYEKKADEDLHSILTGLMQKKGDVHISCGKPISEKELLPYAGLASNAFNKKVAGLIDRQIFANYRLSCNNYIAYDMIARHNTYAEHYSAEEKATFVEYYTRFLDANKVDDRVLLGDNFLTIYANPVHSKNSLR